MKKAETTNSETKNFDNKGMKSELMRIIGENKEIEIDGNKFKFFKKKEDPNKGYFDSFVDDSDCEPEYKYYVIINKDKIKSQVYLKEDGLELKIPYGDTAKINLKNHVFCSSESVKLNEDFSIRSIYGAKDHVMEKESFEGIYLSEFEKPINIHSQNFYTFDKNKNIKGMKQQITFEFDPNYVSEESEEEFEEELEKKFKKKLENYKKLGDNKEELENYKKKLEEKLEDEKMKFNLLKIIKGMNKKKYNNIYLTFKGNNAYALINDKLHFFEKTGKVYEERKDIVKEISDGFIVGLTAFKDKAFVKCIRASKNICEDESKDKIEKYDDSYEPSLDKKSDNSNKPSLGRNVAKIKVFQQRTGQLETTLLSDEYIDFYFRESNFSYLNKINSKKFNVILSEKDFDEKQKKYFDKRANNKFLKEDVKENLNKINDNKIQKRD